jgi:L-aspartate oxidase
VIPTARRPDLRAAMSRHVGVRRDAASLAAAGGALATIARSASDTGEPDRSSWETSNLLTVASAIVAAAASRTESRGCHRRTDFPEPVAAWRRHLAVERDASGAVSVTELPPDAPTVARPA